MRTLTFKYLQTAAQLALGLTSIVVLSTAQAGLTDVSQTPLLTASGTPVKPNVLFVLDDSGSMDYDFLPEAAEFASTAYGSHTSHCNGLAYNANGTYSVQVDAAGANLAAGSIDDVMQANNWLFDNASTSQFNVTLVNSGNLVFDVGGSRSWAVGTPVTLYDNADKKRWMIGVVTVWDTSNGRRKATVAVSDYSGTGTMVTPYIGKGWPPFVYFTYSGSNTALGYTYDGSGNVVTSSSFYTQCNATMAVPSGNGFTRSIMRPNSADAQKMANWWAYYRTRMLMMKTVVSQAFKAVDDKFRVGYATIWNKAYVEGTTPTTTNSYTKSSYDFLEVRDFDATQKSNFYRSLNAANPGDGTPLRGALSNAGRYFARKLPGQVSSPVKTGDPVQYSCQKNFTLLATDGAWNTGGETTSGSNRFGPYKVDGTNTVGQQDGGSTERPLHDAATTSGTGGSSDSLADVAMYFYSTDLRTSTLGNCKLTSGLDVCDNNVKPSGKDTAEWQHMTTYTMSLGQNGTIQYDPNYEKQTSGDFFALKQGTKQWPNPSTTAALPANIDDLWHAAVNGRGTFFNAADPAAVAQGLQTALATIAQLTATGAAAATSTLRPVVGNNQVFVARYTSAQWTGDLRAYRMNVNDGSIQIVDSAGKDIAEWSAAAKLKTNTSRKIYFAKGTTRKDFTYTNLATDYSALFKDNCSKLSQCASLSTTDKATANDGDTFVKYLKGSEYSVFRSREQVLGDIVGSSPVFVGASPLGYSDTTHTTYAKSTLSRKTAVYVGANDGMLHAFDASTGDELWAWVPTTVMANMYKLADQNYPTNHQYFVDGAPTVADVKIGGVWKTVLVGGLGAGGRGYFAIDVTDPQDPKPLWEFTDTNLGLGFAPPLIVQRANSSKDWVVVLSSGYNNVGDGKSHLFMLDASTGTKLADLSAGSNDPGSTTTPSGLGPIAAWVDSTTDSVALRYYAGDTLGNLWRFDPDGVLGHSSKMIKIANLTRSGKTQAITTAPVPAEVNYKGFKTPVVFVGTGRMLGLTDVQNTETQSIYGIKDSLAATGWGDIRGGSSLVGQTLTTSGTVRTASYNAVDWSTKAGWYVDLPDAGERINVEMMLRYNTLVAGSNVPQAVASCQDSNDGYAWLYYLDIASGSNVGTSVATKLSNSMVVGLGAYDLSNGSGGVVATYSQGNPTTVTTPKPRVYLKTAKKSAWRELTDR